MIFWPLRCADQRFLYNVGGFSEQTASQLFRLVSFILVLENLKDNEHFSFVAEKLQITHRCLKVENV